MMSLGEKINENLSFIDAKTRRKLLILLAVVAIVSALNVLLHWYISATADPPPEPPATNGLNL